MNKVISFLYSFAAAAVTALITGYFVAAGTETFYPQLSMPPLTPPSYVFGPIWSVLYTLMAVSYYLILTSRDDFDISTASVLYLGQLFLQMLWGFLFFYAGRFLYALIVIILLILTVWAMIRQFKIINPTAGRLQYPYLIWLFFAAYLNAGVVYLNGNQLDF